MIPVKQKIVDKGNGDCFRACMASMLELPNDDSLPHISSSDYLAEWAILLQNFGFRLNHDFKKIWRNNGYWIATVPSLNIDGVSHCIIMNGFKVAFDPSTKKRYRKGIFLLKDHKIVSQALWIEVSDVSKLKNLEKFRTKLLQPNVEE